MGEREKRRSCCLLTMSFSLFFYLLLSHLLVQLRLPLRAYTTTTSHRCAFSVIVYFNFVYCFRSWIQRFHCFYTHTHCAVCSYDLCVVCVAVVSSETMASSFLIFIWNISKAQKARLQMRLRISFQIESLRWNAQQQSKRTNKFLIIYCCVLVAFAGSLWFKGRIISFCPLVPIDSLALDSCSMRSMCAHDKCSANNCFR